MAKGRLLEFPTVKRAPRFEFGRHEVQAPEDMSADDWALSELASRTIAQMPTPMPTRGEMKEAIYRHALCDPNLLAAICEVGLEMAVEFAAAYDRREMDDGGTPMRHSG